MSSENIELVMQTLGLGPGASSPAPAAAANGAATGGGAGGAPAGANGAGAGAGAAPTEEFLKDLRVLVVSDMARKGFKAHHAEAAWHDTHAAALQVG